MNSYTTGNESSRVATPLVMSLHEYSYTTGNESSQVTLPQSTSHGPRNTRLIQGFNKVWVSCKPPSLESQGGTEPTWSMQYPQEGGLSLPGACNTHRSKVAPGLMQVTEKVHVLTSSMTAVMLNTPSFHPGQYQLCLMMMMMMMMMVVVVVVKMMMRLRLMLEPAAWPADRSPLQVSY